MIEQQAMAEPQSSSRETASIMDVMKNPNFLKLWGAQILSQTAQQIVNFALVLQVQDITHSSTAVSGIIIAFTIPAVLFAAIAGVFVERNSKKTMLVLTNVLRGVMVLAYIFTDSKWGAGAVLPIFYIVTLLFSSVSQFFNPAEASMIPLLVKREELVSANSLFNLTLPATQLGGFIILGPILLTTVFHQNFNGLYILIFILCIAAAGLTYLLPPDARNSTLKGRREHGETVKVGEVAVGATQLAKTGYRAALDELVEGWSFIRRDSIIMNAIIYWSVAIAVFMMLGTIGPGFLEQVLKISADQLLYILMPGGLGLVVGVLIVGRVSRPENRDTTINWSLLVAAVTLIVFAFIYPIISFLYNSTVHHDPPSMLVLVFLGILTFILGVSNSFISVPAQTALQERSPEDKRARVFSAFYTVSNAILLVPVFFAGALADSLGYVPTVAFIGFVVLLLAGSGLLRKRKAGPATHPLNGQVTHLEAEAALNVAAPGARPIPADATQQADADAREEATKSD